MKRDNRRVITTYKDKYITVIKTQPKLIIQGFNVVEAVKK